MKLRAVAVYCGASKGNDPVYTESAYELGRLLATRSIRLVYGGGGIGLMGAVADGALANGGEVTGVIPERLMGRELGHVGVADMRVVETMHERKALMASVADAFVILPGGFGTLDELFEAATWTQLQYHQKACGVLNVAGYYDHMRGLIDHMMATGFVPEPHRTLIQFHDKPAELLDLLEAWTPPTSKFHFIQGPKP